MTDDTQTLDDITTSILGGQTSESNDDADDDLNNSPQGGDLDDDIDLDDGQDDDIVEEDDVDGDDTDDVVDDEEDADDTSGDQTDNFLDIQDEDLIQVKIDGKWETRTIADAKKALSGEGAIDKRLKEATEARKAAQFTQQSSMEQAQTQVNVLRTTVEQMGQALFTPLIKEPDATLINSNPAKYQQEKLHYDNEVKRVSTLKQQFGAVFQHLNQELQNQQKDFRSEQQKLLHEKLPVLSDEKLGKKRQKQIIDAAAHYGFTAEEIKLASDHRLFMMAHDAAMYRAIQDKGGVVKLGKRKTTTPRTLRSGKTTAKMKATRSQKRQQSIQNLAKETGKVDDVAAAILQPAGRKRR